MVTPHFDLKEMASAFNVLCEEAEDQQTCAELEQYLFSELLAHHKEHVVELLENLPNLQFVKDYPTDSTNYLQLIASKNGVKIIVTIFEAEDLISIDVSRVSESKIEQAVNPQHEWFYELWQTLCFISDDQKPGQLTDVEAAVFYIGLLEAEVMNGGIGQYLTNTDGAYINKTVECLKRIGAKKTNQILNDAIKLKGRDDQFIDVWITKTAQLEALDNRFLSSKEDLAGLVAESYLDETQELKKSNEIRESDYAT